jgi:hypothetical protein
MPPAHPELAGIFRSFADLLLHGAPALFLASILPFPSVRRGEPRRVWAAAAAGSVFIAAVAAAYRYVEPDYAKDPRAAVAAMLVLAAVPVLATAAVFSLARSRWGWAWPWAALVALAVGFGVRALCIVPALIVFVELGGDTL